jgi:hypothetical protein
MRAIKADQTVTKNAFRFGRHFFRLLTKLLPTSFFGHA